MEPLNLRIETCFVVTIESADPAPLVSVNNEESSSEYEDCSPRLSLSQSEELSSLKNMMIIVTIIIYRLVLAVFSETEIVQYTILFSDWLIGF